MASATKEQVPEIVAIFLARMPRIFWTLLTSYLHMKKQAKLAGKEFYRVLIENGISPRMARDLRDEYSNMFNLTTIMKGWGLQK